MRLLVYEFLSSGGIDPLALLPAEAAQLLAQGVAMRNAMRDDLVACGRHRVTVACAADEIVSSPVGYELLRPRHRETAESFLARTSPDFDGVWVVAPECSGILARLCQTVGPERWIGCHAAAIGLAASKSATRERLGRCGIDVPACPEEGPTCADAWVVKPDDGAGSQSTRRHRRLGSALADLDRRRSSGQTATIEAWVHGEAMSLSLMARASGIEVLSINRQNVSVGATGEVVYGGVECGVEPLHGAHGRELQALAHRIGTAIGGLRGFVGVDFVRSREGRNVVIEVNPRLTCAYPGLSARLGRNLAPEVVRACLATEVSLAAG